MWKVSSTVRTAIQREREKEGTEGVPTLKPSGQISFSFPCCAAYLLTTFVLNIAKVVGPGLDKPLMIYDNFSCS